MDLGLQGKVAIVGGSSKGMGKAAALRLAQEGARGEADLQRAAQELAAASSQEQVLAITADLSRLEDTERVIEQTTDRFGRLDILVNNIGGPPPGLAQQATEEQWWSAFQQNFLSVQRMTAWALPFMRRQGEGRIITILSTSVKEPIPNLVLSNAVRMATLGFLKTLAAEVGPDNITVNVVGPGAILTDRYRSLAEVWARQEEVGLEEMLERRAQAIPMRRIGSPEDMGDLIAFLASQRAGYITGTFIPLDGGATRAVL